MGEPEIVVEITDLAKHFGPVKAVDGLSLTVRRGEMFCLVGPDGAGKTTTIRLLCGLLPPTAGRMSVLGLAVPERLAEIKPRIGYLSQSFSLYGDLTVDENIEFFAQIHGVRDYRGRRDELLAFTRLTPFRGRLAERLSGGMKQKLALACTLIHTPEVIFLDEPTTGVDPVSRRDFWKILAELLARRITIVMTTPYLDEAERASRVGMINAGKLLVADTPDRIKAALPGAVLEVVAADLRRAHSALAGLPGVRDLQAFGDRLHAMVDDREQGAAAITNALTQAGVALQDLRPIPPTLENVFIAHLRNPARPSSGGAYG